MWVRSHYCLVLDDRWRVFVTDVPPHPKEEVEYHEKDNGHKQHETEAELSVRQSGVWRQPGRSALTQTREIKLTIEEYSVIRGLKRFHDASEDT